MSGAIIRHGQSANFAGFPKLVCINKIVGQRVWPIPAGTEGVICVTNVSASATTTTPQDYIVFELHRLRVYDSTGALVFTDRLP